MLKGEFQRANILRTKLTGIMEVKSMIIRVVRTIEASPEKALYHLPATQDDGQALWNEGNAGAGSIKVRPSQEQCFTLCAARL